MRKIIITFTVIALIASIVSTGLLVFFTAESAPASSSLSLQQK